MRRVGWALALLLAGACGAATRSQIVRSPQQSPVRVRLQAVMAVDAKVVWASGVEGAVVKTTDGGQSWTALHVPGSKELQFRDVHGEDEDTAYLLAAGEGERSRIYKTTDGGRLWTMQYKNKDPAGFLDCFDFWDAQRGVAYGDSVDGELVILRTVDGGESWLRVEGKFLPKAKPGEGGFAASGGCVRVGAEGEAWIGTGANGAARILHTTNWGASWQAYDTPIVTGESAGIMSILAGPVLLAFGGDLGLKDAVTTNVAKSFDGGRRWQIASTPTFTGAVYGAARSESVLVAVGPMGMSISSNEGDSWTALDRRDFWSVDFGSKTRFWAVGPEGRILRIDLPSR